MSYAKNERPDGSNTRQALFNLGGSIPVLNVVRQVPEFKKVKKVLEFIIVSYNFANEHDMFDQGIAG